MDNIKTVDFYIFFSRIDLSLQNCDMSPEKRVVVGRILSFQTVPFEGTFVS